MYNHFTAHHDPTLPIHLAYLIIKLGSATLCLLINYILVTEVIAPYLAPATHASMHFL